MAEIYASNAKANTGVALGASALGVAAINMLGGTDIFKRLFGGNSCNGDSTPLVNRYELGLESEIARLNTQISLRDANIYNDQKLLEVYKYFDGKIEGINSRLCDQAVWNATQTAAINCMGGQIAQLMGLTKTIIPIGNICPSVMPEFNSWTAPTTPTTGA